MCDGVGKLRPSILVENVPNAPSIDYTINMSRTFRYGADPKEVRLYIEGLGFSTKETYNAEGSRITGFTVCDTGVEVSYDWPIYHPDTGELVTTAFGLISFYDSAILTGGDEEKLAQGRNLYNKLYRRFRKKGIKDQSQ
jgi:hypothetical protein